MHVSALWTHLANLSTQLFHKTVLQVYLKPCEYSVLTQLFTRIDCTTQIDCKDVLNEPGFKIQMSKIFVVSWLQFINSIIYLFTNLVKSDR